MSDDLRATLEKKLTDWRESIRLGAPGAGRDVAQVMADELEAALSVASTQGKDSTHVHLGWVDGAPVSTREHTPCATPEPNYTCAKCGYLNLHAGAAVLMKGDQS